MDTKVNARIQQLEFLLKQMDKIHLRDAAGILNVSEMTIRRDLSTEHGTLVLLGGYIVKDPQRFHENGYFIFEQQSKNIAQKMQIGKLAAEQVKEGDVVFFDCGSTIPFIASQIHDSLNFTALCCSINTFMILQEKSQCNLILCGGRYSRDNSFLDSITLQNELDAVCPTKAFISAAGVHHQKGVTCFSFAEAKVKARAIQKSQQNILVFDDSKIDKIQQAYIGELNQFDLLICNQALPERFNQTALPCLLSA
ncbi:DNA-binding transcriptional repressor DeoR [Testudinibacter sp. TR-2022]|uniref:DNA-binding transcriptional repressor DeoR n=1 Tax=Testudinibacter sp. TR-2022 TaxID=2585029 RepID=UPI00111B8FED|nr:DNA-binding transcriptional repressor DeoR [Testudinibacter sp. TR-2022]TNH07250.1 DNA-binding transcriptional repressor DeoR [Pasteurellaceae bacterium Phil11]TNH21120.1 DNA-binding transcriptional repressor DeoR [Testudinibacter sp. TR-2022]TNH27785.1 DNA-binding transcriptional repressor DeoR [Testudinibacter sp. TR-2022]